MPAVLVIILIIIGLVLLFYLAWILIALLVRAFSLLIFYWMIGFSLMLVTGLLYSVVIPWRVLTKRGKFAFRQLTPDDVVAGTALWKARPRGENRHYGWDRAWPMYLPYQAFEDARGVVGETQLIVGGLGESVSRKIKFGKWSGKGVKNMADIAAGMAPKVFWGAVLPIPFAGFWVGVWVSVLAWLVVMSVLGFVVWLAQRLALLGLRWADILFRRRGKAELKCPHCYHLSRTPSYRCSNPECAVIHRSLLPGPLGLTTRRCACGTQLPNTIRLAGRRLTTVCPDCDRDLAQGSGLRHTIQLPIIGSVGAGKTRLLMSATVQLRARLQQRGGMLEGLTPAAEEYLRQAQTVVEQHADTTKTADALPQGLPLVLRDSAGKQTELQLMDAAGESFGSWDRTAELRYLDQALAYLFVLDPLAWPQITRELTLKGLAPSILVTSEDQRDSYAAAIDRMRAENVRLGRRSLGVILSKADILLRLPCARELAEGPVDSDRLRAWMLNHDFDRLITGMEMDFGDVRYFLVDSMGDRNLNDPLNPWWTVQWALQVSKSPVTLVDPPADSVPPPTPPADMPAPANV